jgi:formate-dependent nitrite reductase membrane component NrfD
MSRRSRERAMVPPADFTSYYNRPVLKASPWTVDIPAYLFLGGLGGGGALLGAVGDLTGRPKLRRASRLASLGAITASLAALVHDLGKPSRFLNMLRVAKPTSPMSVGTWILSGFGPLIGVAAVAEGRALVPERLRFVARILGRVERPAGLGAAALGPAVASYTAVLLADTATPTWHGAQRELPFVFVGSAAAAAGGFAMLAVPVDEAGPARRLAIGGAALELITEHQMEASLGLSAEPLHTGMPGRFMRASKLLTAVGSALTVAGGRNRRIAAAAGSSFLAASVCTRFGIFYAGQASARDPKYTVVPQRERVQQRLREQQL